RRKSARVRSSQFHPVQPEPGERIGVFRRRLQPVRSALQRSLPALAPRGHDTAGRENLSGQAHVSVLTRRLRGGALTIDAKIKIRVRLTQAPRMNAPSLHARARPRDGPFGPRWLRISLLAALALATARLEMAAQVGFGDPPRITNQPQSQVVLVGA